MLARYRDAFDSPGAVSFSAAGFVSRFSIAIYPIAIVLIVSGRTHAYGYAGVISGSYVVGSAIGNPYAGALVDRLGQHRVLPGYFVAHAVAAMVFALLITVRAPLWTLVIPAVAMGVTLLNIGALIRARWSDVWPAESAQRSTAYSVESTLDELCFVLGPLVATVLATTAPSLVTLGLALFLIGAGSLWLASQRQTEPPAHAPDSASGSGFALRHRGMLLITVVMVFMGGVFGSGEVVLVAFCGQHGQRGHSGWVVACFALGSGIAGLVYGSRHWRSPLLSRFIGGAVVFGVLPWLWFVPTSVPVLAVCTALIGLGIAPVLITGFGLVDSIVPPASLTEGLTWIGTGLSVGYGAGAAVVGGIADRHGAHFAFAVPVASAVLVAVFGLVLASRMRVPAAA